MYRSNFAILPNRQHLLPFSLVSTFGGKDNHHLASLDINGIVTANAMNGCHSCEEYTTVDELLHIAEVTLGLMVSEA